MYGVSDAPSAVVTILALRSNVEAANITRDDIVYLNQFKTQEDGSFAITLPWSEDETYTVRSNTDFNLYNSQNGKETVYVSPAYGNDSNSGTNQSSALQSLEAAYRQIFHIGEIVLLDDTEYIEAPEHEGELIIKGINSAVKLTIPAEVSLKGDLTFDNLVLNLPNNNNNEIYANGFWFKTTQTVTSTVVSKENRPFVYGGKKSASLFGDTHVTLLGGKFWNVYGGGNGGKIYGNTNVVFGGNANYGDGINDDDKSTLSPTFVFGGGKNALVSGKTNVTLSDNAVAYYLVGAGYMAGGTANDTNIFIEGGKAMNVYAGQCSYNNPDILSGCDTHVTMTGGLVEAIFGGCENTSMTGSAYITLKGGEVTRRVYSGCYNSNQSSDNHIKGSTTLAIYPEANLVTGTGLSWGNQLDSAIKSGSRYLSASIKSEEVNTIIFLNDAYNIQKDKVKSNNETYVVSASLHGEVRGTSAGDAVDLLPEPGYVGKAGGQESSKYTFSNTNSLSSPVIIEFVSESASEYGMQNLEAVLNGSEVDGSVNVTLNGSDTRPTTLFIALYEKMSNGMEILLGIDAQAASGGNETFTIPCKLEKNKKYIVKSMLWDGDTLRPLSTSYSIDLK